MTYPAPHYLIHFPVERILVLKTFKLLLTILHLQKIQCDRDEVFMCCLKKSNDVTLVLAGGGDEVEMLTELKVKERTDEEYEILEEEGLQEPKQEEQDKEKPLQREEEDEKDSTPADAAEGCTVKYSVKTTPFLQRSVFIFTCMFSFSLVSHAEGVFAVII